MPVAYIFLKNEEVFLDLTAHVTVLNDLIYVDVQSKYQIKRSRLAPSPVFPYLSRTNIGVTFDLNSFGHQM